MKSYKKQIKRNKTLRRKKQKKVRGGAGIWSTLFGTPPVSEVKSNAVKPNALKPNALKPNALKPNAVTLNPVTPPKNINRSTFAK